MNVTTPRGTTSSYESTYRRSEIAMPCVFAVLAIFLVGVVSIVRTVESRDMGAAVLTLGGVTLVLLLVILVTALRVHSWAIRPQGIAIFQGPKVPLTGLSRSTTVAFQDIAAFRNVESGFESRIEITTRDGRRFRLSQVMAGGARTLPRPDPGADLRAFAASIRAAAEQAGHMLPTMSEGLSFWNSRAGLAFLVVVFATALAIAVAVAVAMWSGMTVRPRPRGGEAVAILLLLPVGAGYLLARSWKRRAAVLAALAAQRRT